MPLEIACGNGESLKPLQLPIQIYQPEYPITSNEQPVIDITNLPKINLDEYSSNSGSDGAEESEDLVSDSDAEDENDLDTYSRDQICKRETCFGSDFLDDSEDS